MLETAKKQFEEYQRNGIQDSPYWAIPFLDLIQHRGKDKAEELLAFYQKYYADTPCVRDGLLLKSYEKHLRETQP